MGRQVRCAARYSVVAAERECRFQALVHLRPLRFASAVGVVVIVIRDSEFDGGKSHHPIYCKLLAGGDFAGGQSGHFWGVTVFHDAIEQFEDQVGVVAGREGVAATIFLWPTSNIHAGRSGRKRAAFVFNSGPVCRGSSIADALRSSLFAPLALAGRDPRLCHWSSQGMSGPARVVAACRSHLKPRLFARIV